MSTIGIGLLGGGWMGRVHSSAYLRLPTHYPDAPLRPRLVLVADSDMERADAAVRDFGYGKATTDWREVIDHPDVEAVSITAPNHLHRDMAVAAAAAGKPFWGEKPLGRSPEETAEIVEAARASGVIGVVGFNYRHAPAVEHARRLLADGAIGDPTHYRSLFLADYASHPRAPLSWRFLRDEGGLGVLGDLMSHAVDLARWLVGPVDEVVAEQATFIPRRVRPSATTSHFALVEGGEPEDVENEDYAATLVRFANGARGVLESSRVAVGSHARYGFEVSGTRGALAWDFERPNELRVDRGGDHAAAEPGSTRVVAGPEHGAFARFQPGRGLPMGFDDLKVVEASVFVRSIADGVGRPPGLDDAMAMAEVVAAIQRSVELGGWARVEPLRGPGAS